MLKKWLIAVVLFYVFPPGKLMRLSHAQGQEPSAAQLASISQDPSNPARALITYTTQLYQRQKEVASRLSALNCSNNSGAVCKCIQDYSGKLLAESSEGPPLFQSCLVAKMQ